MTSNSKLGAGDSAESTGSANVICCKHCKPGRFCQEVLLLRTVSLFWDTVPWNARCCA